MAGELPFEKPLNDMRQKVTELKTLSVEKGIDFTEEILRLEQKCKQLEEELYSELSPAQKCIWHAIISVQHRLTIFKRYLRILWSCMEIVCLQMILLSLADLLS